MLEYLFLKLKNFINFFKLCFCKLIFINHFYTPIIYSKPYWLYEKCGGGNGVSIYEGIFIDKTKKCRFCGKEETEFYFKNGYFLIEIEEFYLPKNYLNNPKIPEIIKLSNMLSNTVEKLNKYTFYKFNIIKSKYSKNFILKSFEDIQNLTFNTFDDYVVIFKY